MRERTLLYLFLALNVALAGAFIAYLFLSNSGQPPAISTTFASPAKTNVFTSSAVSNVPAGKPQAARTNVAVTVQAEIKPASASVTNQQPEFKPVFTQKKFSWEQVGSDNYLKYIDSLRAVGCPEEKVRYIILADINELCAKKRIKEAVAHDTQWWRAEPELIYINI